MYAVEYVFIYDTALSNLAPRHEDLLGERRYNIRHSLPQQ